MRFVVSILVFLGLGLAPLAAAEPYGAPKQVMLSAKIVESFVSSWDPARALAEKYQAKWDEESLSDNKATGLGKLRAHLEGRGALAEFDRLVGGYGFSGFDHWSQVAYSVFIAHAFARQGSNAASTDAGMAQAMQSIENNLNLTAEQKAAMRAQMTGSMGAYEQMQPPPENVAVVKPFGKQLAALLDEE